MLAISGLACARPPTPDAPTHVLEPSTHTTSSAAAIDFEHGDAGPNARAVSTEAADAAPGGAWADTNNLLPTGVSETSHIAAGRKPSSVTDGGLDADMEELRSLELLEQRLEALVYSGHATEAQIRMLEVLCAKLGTCQRQRSE
jgi:hypothetical protein